MKQFTVTVTNVSRESQLVIEKAQKLFGYEWPENIEIDCEKLELCQFDDFRELLSLVLSMSFTQNAPAEVVQKAKEKPMRSRKEADQVIEFMTKLFGSEPIILKRGKSGVDVGVNNDIDEPNKGN